MARRIHNPTGRRTFNLMPEIYERIRNMELKPNYYLTQFLTVHGNFGEYLERFKVREEGTCYCCKEENDTPDNTFLKCRNFEEIRKYLK